MNSYIDKSGNLISTEIESIFWINVYQSIGIFSGKKYTWSTGTTFKSKEQALKIGYPPASTDVKYIGAYRITLKPLNT